ncbi:hypothetical protein DPX16_5225 [Anabarilius grahami]|uniref:Protein kinase domain-containing protein n=1 Tax=Anabarilius grahami TaxID=495550 RepID=A0A3N0Y1E1_ANAGA|nr:hypothetical protein DPX16_5225 [Anabarilius grahami]
MAAHSRGVFHSDIKLENLLINTETLGQSDRLWVQESGYERFCVNKMFAVTVQSHTGSGTIIHLKNSLKQLDTALTWHEVLEKLCPDLFSSLLPSSLTVTVSTDLKETTKMLVEETQTIEDVLQFDPQIKVVSFKLKFQSETPPPNNTRNAFSIMMGQAKTPKDPMLRSCNNGWPQVAEPWDIVGMDLVGMVTPTKEGYQ